MIKVTVQYMACTEERAKLEKLFRDILDDTEPIKNPWTLFREYTEKIAQDAFDEGRQYEKSLAKPEIKS